MKKFLRADEVDANPGKNRFVLEYGETVRREFACGMSLPMRTKGATSRDSNISRGLCLAELGAGGGGVYGYTLALSGKYIPATALL